MSEPKGRPLNMDGKGKPFTRRELFQRIEYYRGQIQDMKHTISVDKITMQDYETEITRLKGELEGEVKLWRDGYNNLADSGIRYLKALKDADNCLVCGGIADPIEIIENTRAIITNALKEADHE